MVEQAHQNVAARLDEIRGLLSGRLGASGADLASQARRARRHLPWGVRRELAQLARTQARLRHPVGATAVDYADTIRRADFVITQLRQIDPMQRHIGRILGTLAVIAANGLILLALTAWIAQRFG